MLNEGQHLTLAETRLCTSNIIHHARVATRCKTKETYKQTGRARHHNKTQERNTLSEHVQFSRDVGSINLPNSRNDLQLHSRSLAME